jgi:hypothetical protein
MNQPMPQSFRESSKNLTQFFQAAPFELPLIVQNCRIKFDLTPDHGKQTLAVQHLYCNKTNSFHPLGALFGHGIYCTCLTVAYFYSQQNISQGSLQMTMERVSRSSLPTELQLLDSVTREG